MDCGHFKTAQSWILLSHLWDLLPQQQRFPQDESNSSLASNVSVSSCPTTINASIERFDAATTQGWTSLSVVTQMLEWYADQVFLVNHYFSPAFFYKGNVQMCATIILVLGSDAVAVEEWVVEEWIHAYIGM